MTEFKIQDTMSVKNCGTRCARCTKIIDRREGLKRVKYGHATFHIGCFYTWLKGNVPLLEKKTASLKDYHNQLKKHMPQIVAESIVG